MFRLKQILIPGIFVIFFTLVHLHFVSGQIHDETVRDMMQPFPLKAPLTLSCCDHIEDSTDLMRCVRDSTYTANFLHTAADFQPAVTLYTYITKNIHNYASLAMAVNAVYAEHNHYDLRILGEDSGSSSDKTNPYQNSLDPRWNKIDILRRALENGTADGHYIAWIDADLVIMDLGMRIEQIGDEYVNNRLLA